MWESRDGLGVFEGAPAVRGFLEDFTKAYATFDTRVEQLSDLGGGIVLVVIRHSGRLRGAAGHVEQRFAWAAVWREGLIARVLAGMDVDAVRAAAERLAGEAKRRRP